MRPVWLKRSAMRKNHPLPTQAVSVFRQFITLFAFVLLLMTVFRAAFWIFAAPDMPEPLSWDTLNAFYIGFRFDARLTAFFLLPLVVALCVPWLAARLHRQARAITIAYAILFFLLIAVYSVDFGFYDYLKTRVSFLLFELMADVNEAFGMTTQSYPVVWITLSVLAVAALCTFIFYRIIRVPVYADPRRSRRVLTILCILAIVGVALYGRLFNNWFPLRWSNAFFTTQKAVIALGLNPVQNIYDTWELDVADFSADDARAAYPDMVEYLRVDKPNIETLSYRRSVPAITRGATRPNIVIVIMESLAYSKTSFAPGNADPTPNLRELAKESLLFNRFYSNTWNTARGVFTIITGIPDINRGKTSSRNPLLADQRVLAAEFEGYDKYYMIGGNTSWANVRAVLARNIPELTILEEGDWQASGVDVWGVSDYDLFQEASARFAARDPNRPFLAVIQTASFHRPYTVPETPGLIAPEATDADIYNHGFESRAEYASMHFADFALGEFIRAAKAEAYYDNTIFFITGDHGLNDSMHHMPPGYLEANVQGWHTPLLIHASPRLGLVTPGESNLPGSHVDIFPTAAALAGIAYENNTLGRDLFDTGYNNSRTVYLGNKDVGMRLIDGDYCFLDNGAGGLYLFEITGDNAENLAEAEPERFARMHKQALEIDATVRYMLFNNSKDASAQAEP